MKVTAVYFSPTDNTRRCVEAMARALADEPRLVNVTTYGSQPRIEFAADEWLIVGMPVYGGRIPAVARPRIEKLHGEGTRCIIVATYGNRHYDDALLEMADMMRGQGFRVMGAAAVVGRHTYGDIQVTRPDADDLAACADFARRTASLPDDAPEAEVPSNRPYREGGSGGRFRPYRGWGCTGCDRCRQECPVNAIADNLNDVRDNCIACFRCIRHCPLGAKQMIEPDYFEFAKAFTERLSARRENEWFGAAAQ